MKKILNILPLICLLGCTSSEVKSNLGLKKKSPDEFMVLAHPALTVPPSFDLPDPQTTSVTASKDSSSNAKQVLFGTAIAKESATTKTTSKKPSAENLFLSKAGVGNSQSNIRELLDDDLRAEQPPKEEEEEKGFFGRLFTPIKLDDKPDPIVNPEAEKERIKESKARGEKVDGDDAATIQPKGETVLDRIF